MFGNFVQRIQESFSPVTSPVSSPKALRRRFKSPSRGPAPARAAQPPSRSRGPSSRRNHKEEYREVQSEPELDNNNPSSTGSRRLLDKRKTKTRKVLNISDPIPIVSGKVSNGTGLGLYSSTSDIMLPSPMFHQTESQGFNLNQSVEYGTVKSGEHIYGTKCEKSHLKEINQNGYVYVSSVPNIIDKGLYENQTGMMKESSYEVVGNRKNSRLQEFNRTRKDNLYAGFAPLQGSKSLGRLDGIKEVSTTYIIF